MYIIHIDGRSIYSLINTLLVCIVLITPDPYECLSTCTIQVEKLVDSNVKNSANIEEICR